MDRRRWLALCVGGASVAGPLAAACAPAGPRTDGWATFPDPPDRLGGAPGGHAPGGHAPAGNAPAGGVVDGAGPGGARLGLPDLRAMALGPTDLPGAGLAVVEELAPSLAWRTPEEDPWGRVSSYAVTYRATAPADGHTGPYGLATGSEITCSLNAYVDAVRAREAFSQWRSLVPSVYRQLAHGRWAAAGAGELAVLSAPPRGTGDVALIGFTVGPVIGSVAVWRAAGGAAPDDPEPPAAGVGLGLRLTDLLAARLSPPAGAKALRSSTRTVG